MIREGHIDTSSPEAVKASCHAYISGRTSSYEFRCIRYEAVYEQLKSMGLSNTDRIVDVGAGDGEFGRYLKEQGWSGQYIPVDGLIDGTDLNTWIPNEAVEFFTSIEVIEHLYSPSNLLKTLGMFALKGAVVTTPNPTVVDVYAMDKTHISEVSAIDFLREGWRVVPQIFFFEPEDSLLAWTTNPYNAGYTK